jgi:hypothetical protein
MPQQPLSQVPADATWEWQEQGACREADPELFFHPQNERGLARLRRDRAAKAVCARCDVRIALAQFPRQRGEGAVAAAEEIANAVSATSLGVVS